ncbi:MAG: hypothetical protein JST84_02760 [Acidobacteria bacterium]|nr:hypothetical protein [Acidobacteriota bacterium]
MRKLLPLLLSGKRQVQTADVSEWTAARSISLFGIRIGIQTNEPEWLAPLADHFPPLWKPTEARTVDRIFSLWKGKSRYTLFENDELAVKARSRKVVWEDFERRLKIYVAEMARRRVFVHAGAVGLNGKAIIIPGRSYSGKTSLVKALIEAGATYYSDEYAVLDMQGRVHPYPQPLALREPGKLEQTKCSAEAFGAVVGTKPLPVDLVIVSKYREKARWRPMQLTPGHGVLELLDNTVPARRKPEVVLPTLQKAVTAATILKGDRGEVEVVVNRILERYA